MKCIMCILISISAMICAQENEIQVLKQKLQTTNYLQKTQALQELSFMYEEASPLLPELLSMLHKEKGQVLYLLVEVIGHIGIQAQKAVPQLVDLLIKSDDFSLRYGTIVALGQIQNQEALPVLLDTMEDEDANIRAASIIAIYSISPPDLIPLLSKYSADEDVLVQKAIISCIQHQKNNHDISDILIASLKNSDPEVRFLATQSLQITPQNVDKILPIYLEFLQGKDPKIITNVLSDFALSGMLAEPAIPHILPFLTQKNLDIYASYALTKIGKPTIPYIEKLLYSDNQQERSQAVKLLAKLSEKETFLMRFVKMSIEDNSVLVRNTCLSALSNIEEVSQESIDYLQQQLSSPQKVYAIQTVGTLQITDFVPQLKEFLQDASFSYRKELYIALGNIALKDDTVVDILKNGLIHENIDIKKVIVLYLGKMKGKAEPAVLELGKLLMNKEDNIYISVINILGEIGEEAAPVLPDVYKIFASDSNRIIKFYCMNTMAKMGDKSLPFFMQSLDSPNFLVRFYGVSGLFQLNNIDIALPKLLEMSKKDSAYMVKEKAKQLYNYYNSKLKKSQK